jgi:hypothetical protein
MLIDYQVISLHVGIAKESEAKLDLILGMSLNTSVIKECCHCIYKTMTPIEDLPTEEKQGLWDYVKQKFPNLSTNDKVQLSKNLYVIGSLF